MGQQIDRRHDDDDNWGSDGCCTQLCDLPEVILERIIALLPTVDAARASMAVASKGWESLWRSSRKLEFDEKRFGGDGDRLLKAFSGVMRLREGPSVELLSLSCHINPSFSRQQLLVSSALRRYRSLQELRLCLSVHSADGYALPPCILRSETLRKLRIEGSPGRIGMPRYGGYVHLPSLQELALARVNFRDDQCTLQKLLSSPSLEVLSLHSTCYRQQHHEEEEVVTVSAPALHTLTIHHDSYSPVFDVAFDAPHLKRFRYVGAFWVPKHSIPSSPFLTEAELELAPRYSDVSTAPIKRFHKLLLDINSVESLILSTELIQLMATHLTAFDMLPDFSNLKKLKLVGRHRLNCVAFASLLGTCPSLKTLHMWCCIVMPSPLYGYKHSPGGPPFHLPKIEKISISKFGGLEEEIAAVGTLLSDAPVLQEMLIHYRRGRRGASQHVIEDSLNRLPKASKTCKILTILVPKITKPHRQWLALPC